MAMQIWAIGAGYVGLVAGACMAHMGHTVAVYDTDAAKVDFLNAGGCPLHEEGLPALLKEGRAQGRLSFHNALPERMDDVDAVVVGVGTPQDPQTGYADLRHLDSAFADLLPRIGPRTVVVTKSTVPVGTAERLARWMAQERPDLEGHTASNPEFLREGSAVHDFLHPDRIVSGARTARGAEVLRAIYQPLEDAGHPHFVTDTRAAELAKYASNAFLAAKITFANGIAALAEELGADAGPALQAMGMDARIGPKFLAPGPGYGGSCFPKDTQAIAAVGREANAVQHIVEATMVGNAAAQQRAVDAVVRLLDGDLIGKTIAVLGLAFKPNTDDGRDAPALAILPHWLAQGARVVGCDPAAAEAVAAMVPGLELAASAEEAVVGADAVVLLTEWKAYTGLDLAALRRSMAPKAVAADMRRGWDLARLRAAGFDAMYRVGDGTV
jgi:UDPglucose 6-dehydrogenase